MTDRTNVISVEYDTELSRLIKQCVVYDEDKKGQQRDQSYWSALHQKEIKLS